jgi:hypothetical protein
MGFATSNASRRWRRHVVPFVIDDSVRENPQNVEAVELAVEMWNAGSCLRFRPKRDSDVDFVEFVRHLEQCTSPLGRQGGRQQIRCPFESNDSDQLKGKAGRLLHEMGHAVGLFHEFQRPDRDAFVSVSANAVKVDAANFQRLSENGRQRLGAYDCFSIMHYPALEGLLAPHPNGCSELPSQDGRALSEGDVKALAHMHAYIRRKDSGDDAIGKSSEVAIANFREREIVTAIRSEAGNLKVMSWAMDDEGRFAKTGDSGNQAGKASHIDLARGDDRFVVACRTDEGRLRLINWAVTGVGPVRNIEREGDSGDQAGEATLNRIVHVQGRFFVTASRTAQGNLKLIGWRVQNNGTLRRIADSGDQAGRVEAISLAMLGNEMVTAVRAANDTLKVILWNWDVTANPPAETIQRMDESDEDVGEASLIRAVGVRFSGLNPLVFVSFRRGDGTLRIAAWRRVPGKLAFVADSGIQAESIGDVEGNALALQDLDRRVLVSAVRADDRLRLLAWRFYSKGISLIGDSGDDGGDVGSAIALTPLALPPSPPFNNRFVVSCGQRSSERMELISWTPCPLGGLNAPDTEPTPEFDRVPALVAQ